MKKWAILAILIASTFGFYIATTNRSFLSMDLASLKSKLKNDESCSALLSPSVILERHHRLGKKSQYMWKTLSEERMSPIINGSYQAFMKYAYALGAEPMAAIIFAVKTQKAPIDLSAPAPEPSENFARAAYRAVNFVIDIYQERRQAWPEKFRDKLRKVAKEYLPESTYIVIEEGTGTRERDILGTIRFIKEKNGRLPMEEYLGIDISGGNKLKVEPGNFAIAKNQNEDAWSEIVIHLFNTVAREIEPHRENYYLTYADKYSLALYSALGFKPVNEERIRKLKPDTIMENGKILADGIWWTPMEATQATIDGVYEKHLNRACKNNDSDAKSELLGMRRDEITASHEFDTHNFIGKGTDNGQEVPMLLRVDYMNQETVGFNLTPNPPNEGRLLGVIYKKDLPLKEGHIPAYLGDKITYKNGVLTFIKSEHSLKVEIKTTPDLSVITRAKRDQVLPDGTQVTMDANF